MALPVLVLAAIAVAAALIGLRKPPPWLMWLPPWAATVTAAVLGVLGTWVAGPWATRRQAATEAERKALDQLRSHLGRQGHLARIGETSAQAMALRVHPAISLPPDGAGTAIVAAGRPARRPQWLRRRLGGITGRRPVARGLDRDLPTFVERDKSGEIREAMRQARQKGGFIVLVGDSCVGKTRLLYETAIQELGDFAVLAPDLGDGNLVNTIAAGTFPLLPKLIVWLDELQRFLEGPYLYEGESAITAASVRRLLDASTPVVVLASMWPEHGRNLREERPDPSNGQSQSLYPRTVEILKDSRVQPFDLLTFSEAEQKSATRLAARDPRLTAALADKSYGLTEALAGAPELVHRYERATTEQRAIIHAAVDARRLGIQAPLTEDLLRAAARGYLTTLHPDDTWFSAALKEISTDDRPQDKATAPLVALLNPHRTQIVGYIVADYLLQYLTRQRRSAHLPVPTWEAFTDHPHPRDDLARAAESAHRRLMYGYAETLYRRWAVIGDDLALLGLAELHAEQGRIDAAGPRLFRRVLAGDGSAVTQFNRRLRELSQHEELPPLENLPERWTDRSRWAGHREELRRRAYAGSEPEVFQLARVLAEEGDVDELRLLADTGAEFGRLYFAQLLAQQGLIDELRQRAGDEYAAGALAGLLVLSGRIDELRQRARDGDRHAVHVLATHLRVRGLGELRELANTGNEHAARELASLLRQYNLIDELRERTAAGDKHAAVELADLLAQQNHTDEALHLLRRCADDGNKLAAMRWLDLLTTRGRADEALPLLRQRADIGDHFAAAQLARQLVQQRRTDELRQRSDAGDHAAAAALVELLREQGRIDELRREVRAGTPGAGRDLISLLISNDATKQEGHRLRRFGLNPDGSVAHVTAEKD